MIEDKSIELSEKDLQLVVSKQELGTLETNALAIKEKIKELLPNYDPKNYSSANIDKAKEDKALLDKTSKVLNDKRIELEREFMKPFESFKEIIKETTDLIKTASSQIDVIVKDVENKEKEEKKNEIIKIFNEKIKELSDLIPFERIFDEKWLNKTAKMKDIESSIETKLEQIRNDLITISELHSKYEIELKNDFLKHFDLGLIIRKNSELIQKEEALKVQTEETEKVIEEQKEEKMQKMAEEVVPPKIADDIKTYTLKITGTTSQLKALRRFLEINGMSFEKIQ